MTKEQILKSLRICQHDETGCAGCIFFNTEGACRSKLMKMAADLIENTSTPVTAKAQADAAPGLISEIMGHYKKPLVNISFQEMEDGES